MGAMDSYRKKSSSDAKAILESGISTLDALTSALAAMPYKGITGLSQAESAFVAMIGGGDVEKSNDVVDAAYKVTRDALAMGSEHTRTLERFVGLHIPQMGGCLCLLFIQSTNDFCHLQTNSSSSLTVFVKHPTNVINRGENSCLIRRISHNIQIFHALKS